jgi:hypothetical protein
MMVYYNEDEEREPEPQELPEVRLDQPGTCRTCGKGPECPNGCFRCGRPVHYNAQSYLSDSPCGGWILDTWHNDHPEGNEFYCNECLHAGLIEPPLTVGGLTFAYTDHKSVTVTIDGGQARELTTEETRDLVAFLYDQRKELFMDERQVSEPEPVTVGKSFQGGDDLSDHPF